MMKVCTLLVRRFSMPAWSISIIVSFTQLPRYTVCLCLVGQLYHIIIKFAFFHTTTHDHSSPFICHLNRLCHWHGIQIYFVYDSRLIFCLPLRPLLLAFVHNSVHIIYQCSTGWFRGDIWGRCHCVFTEHLPINNLIWIVANIKS